MKFDYNDARQYKGYNVMKGIAKCAFPMMYKIKYVGQENIPQHGGYIIACNHQKAIDPAIICAGVKSPVHFMAKQELFENDVVGYLCKHCNSFPVRRGEGDMSAINYAVDVIKKGWILGIFPEGTRSKEFKPMKGKSGVALIAKMTGADVLPVAIYTSDEFKKGTQLTVRFGKVIKNEELGFVQEHSPKELRSASKRVMEDITALWEQGHEA